MTSYKIPLRIKYYVTDNLSPNSLLLLNTSRGVDRVDGYPSFHTITLASALCGVLLYAKS